MALAAQNDHRWISLSFAWDGGRKVYFHLWTIRERRDFCELLNRPMKKMGNLSRTKVHSTSSLRTKLPMRELRESPIFPFSPRRCPCISQQQEMSSAEKTFFKLCCRFPYLKRWVGSRKPAQFFCGLTTKPDKNAKSYLPVLVASTKANLQYCT